MNEPSPQWLREWAERMEGKVDRLDKFLTGASEPERGLNLRVGRLEDDAKRRTQVVGWTFAAAITAAVSSLWSWLRSHA